MQKYFQLLVAINMGIFETSSIIVMVCLVLLPADVTGRPSGNAGDQFINLLLRALDDTNSVGNQVTGTVIFLIDHQF